MTELSAFWENVKGSSGKGERTMREKVCLLLLLVLLLTGCGAQKDAVKAEGPEQTRQQAMETAEPEVKSAAAETDQNMTATMVEKKAVRSKSAGRPFFISQILRSKKKKFCVNFAY